MTEKYYVDLGFKPVKEIFTHLHQPIENGALNKSLIQNRECSFTNYTSFSCQDLRLISDKANLRLAYQLIQIDMEPL